MIRKKVAKRKIELGQKDWWDRQCYKKKREVRICYKKWRKGKTGKEKYMEERRKLKKLAERKQREKREGEEKELKNLRNLAEVWRFINRKRKKRTWKEAEISKEVWRSYFMELLEGNETQKGRVNRGEEGEIISIREERIEGQLEEEEIGKAVRKLKMKKAVGVDGIPIEAWKFGEGAVKKGLVEILRQIWKEGYIPKDWKMSIIVPLYKRGDTNKAGNYRGISLLCSAYKIYAEILRNRLEDETERLGLLPENLKAAFDNVEREQLWKGLREKKVAEDLVCKVERIYEETEVAVRVKEDITEKFFTTKGVRQVCVMSPLLFNLYVAEIGKELERRNIGGIRVGRNRLWSLEGNREQKESWKWEGKDIEEVKVFKYLGFVFNSNGNYKEHIKDLYNKGRYLVQSVMSYGVEIWGWEEKKELERVMLDYVRWLFRLEFCTPRYLMSRELGLKKLRIEWGIISWRYEEKIRGMEEIRWVKKCWMEKEVNRGRDMYSRKREKYYNRNGWGIEALEILREEGIDISEELRNRDREVQRQLEDNKIREARYNKKYKDLETRLEGPMYLKEGNMDIGNLGDSVKALLRLRCKNMEDRNKYWLGEEAYACVFCGIGEDCINHYFKDCDVTKSWFIEIGKNENEVEEKLWNDVLDDAKGRLLRKIWKEKENVIKKNRNIR
ncbi:uncharacterized protein LOC115243745 [Formica exsecta]|uniref:uncharacterized protein LOC115243745 n=1 Tax=Formica exsecta TaxID=72781 RepID=UPI0011412459|nr:uncharacterized protein LOC115243745 [Formica exsecta]